MASFTPTISIFYLNPFVKDLICDMTDFSIYNIGLNTELIVFLYYNIVNRLSGRTDILKI